MRIALKVTLFFFLLVTNLSAIERSEKLFECTQIFESRKEELLVELERIDEQRQSLESLKIATDELLKKKAAKISERESKVAAQLKEIKERESIIKSTLDENKKILETIKNRKMDKISQVYAKMKSASAANVLSKMEVSEAGKILNRLKPKIVGKILSKMDAQKASDLSSYITK